MTFSCGLFECEHCGAWRHVTLVRLDTPYVELIRVCRNCLRVLRAEGWVRTEVRWQRRMN